jgi:hypothetical protein
MCSATPRSPTSREGRSKRTKTGDLSGDPQVARVVAVDQVQPSGEPRLAPTELDPRCVSAFLKQKNEGIGRLFLFSMPHPQDCSTLKLVLSIYKNAKSSQLTTGKCGFVSNEEWIEVYRS